MSLYTEWRNLSDNHESQEAEVKFWEAYLQAEASIYNELLKIIGIMKKFLFFLPFVLFS